MHQYFDKRRRRALRFLAFATATAALGAGSAHAADVVSTWIDQVGGAGNWNVAANWSNSPNVAQFPNNGNGGFTYDAIVNSPTGNAITLGQNIDVQNFTLNGATIAGANTLTVNNVMTFTAGALRNATTVVPAGASFVLNPSSRVTLTGTWDNFGTGTWTGSGITGDTFAAGGVFNNHAGATFFANNSFGSQRAFGVGSFINAGTMLKTAGTESRWGNITTIDNSGTLEVRTGTIRFVGPVMQVAAGVLNGGSWIINPTGSATGATIQLDQAFGLATIGANARVDVSGATSVFSAIDNVSANQGFLRVNNGYHFNAITSYTNSGTTVVDSGSALKVTGTLTNTGTIDINRGGGMLVDYTGSSPINTITSQIAQARHGGAWDLPGITSTSARNANPKNTTLGVLEGSSYLAINGAGATFFGTPVDADMVLVKYTYYGDTDLNGVVNFDDYSRTDAGFNNGRSGWLNGDFDGNGVVNFDDYSLIDLAFNTQNGALRAVPEPSTIGYLVPLIAMRYRRRRRNNNGSATTPVIAS